ncbi:hypothetical protein [Erythrobacter rubeus]|uniref:Uncharacterized protein n=1 Tax=Erythrobacter rubeus TaxID=2760803 RepID=A0ABR8KR24_9SPHN|nr:hypothetical protein [Erythrobacter rubeus]MBD2840889.1 hypothetical protein [Erythrobacter rubeus]
MTQSNDNAPAKHTAVPDENGAGSHDAYGNALPDGITCRIVREYIVGPYRYTDLSQAIAERDRQRMVNEE